MDYDIDPQGLNCDMDDLPCVPQKRKRRKRNKKDLSIPGEEEGRGKEHEDPEVMEEAVDEDDVDDLEVDVIDGASRMVRRGMLKAEAKVIQYLLIHRYKTPY